jgi:hypothetical protein
VKDRVLSFDRNDAAHTRRALIPLTSFPASLVGTETGTNRERVRTAKAICTASHLLYPPLHATVKKNPSMPQPAHVVCRVPPCHLIAHTSIARTTLLAYPCNCITPKVQFRPVSRVAFRGAGVFTPKVQFRQKRWQRHLSFVFCQDIPSAPALWV